MMSESLHTPESIIRLAEEAKKNFQAGNFKLAIQQFEQARAYYQESGTPLDAAEMANNLSVAYLQANLRKKALEAVFGTDSVFAAAGDIQKQAMALGNLGAAQEANKMREEAAISYQRSADLFAECGEKEMRTTVLRSLSALQIRQGNQFEGLLAMQRSLDAKEKLTLKDRILRWLLKIPFRLVGR